MVVVIGCDCIACGSWGNSRGDWGGLIMMLVDVGWDIDSSS